MMRMWMGFFLCCFSTVVLQLYEFLPVWSNRSVCAVAVKWFQTDFEIGQLVLRYSNNKVRSRKPACSPQEQKGSGRRGKKKGAGKEAGDLGMTSPSRPAHENQMFSAAPSPPIFVMRQTPRGRRNPTLYPLRFLSSIPSSWTPALHVRAGCTDSWEIWGDGAENCVGVLCIFTQQKMWSRLRKVGRPVVASFAACGDSFKPTTGK